MLNLNDAGWEQVESILVPVAKHAARKGHGRVEADDAAQQLRVWVLEHVKQVAEWLQDGDRAALAVALQNAAIEYARSEIDAATAVTGPFPWQLDLLVDALTEMFAGMSPGDDMPDGSVLGRALSKLSSTDWNLLWYAYGEHRTQAATGEMLGISQSRVSRLRVRAMVRLWRLTQQEAAGPHVGARRAMTNIEAAEITNEQY